MAACRLISILTALEEFIFRGNRYKNKKKCIGLIKCTYACTSSAPSLLCMSLHSSYVYRSNIICISSDGNETIANRQMARRRQFLFVHIFCRNVDWPVCIGLTKEPDLLNLITQGCFFLLCAFLWQKFLQKFRMASLLIFQSASVVLTAKQTQLRRQSKTLFRLCLYLQLCNSIRLKVQ